jgi:hypothetical protein
MDPYLEAYKQKTIAELVSAFNNNVQSLKTRLLTNINKIRMRSKIRNKIKAHNILFFNKKYNANVAQLKKKLNNDIKKVNQATSFPQRNIPGKFASLIGINYKNTSNELNGCINDTKNIKNLLQEKYGFNNFGFLTDDTPTKPTKQTIIYSLTSLLKNSISGDSLFFLYSGHGTCTTDLNNDELDGQDELIVPINATSINMCISDDELNLIIKNNLKPGVTLFALFDSCFSGTVLDLKYNLDSSDTVIVNPSNQDTLGQVFMISGCTDQQTSADAFIGGKSSGAMTFAFTQTIKQYGTSITLKQLVTNMRQLLSDSGLEQIPQLAWGSVSDIDTNILFITQ